MTRHKVGICLSGGGARGIAHIGVLRALLEHGIEPTIVAGASAGSIVGALYAAGLPIAKIEDFVKSASLIRVLKPGLSTKGLINISYLKDHLKKYIHEDQFESLKYPLFVAVSNLNSGLVEIYSTGPLFDRIMASSAIPLVFKPLEHDGQVFVDGGLLMNMPAEPIRDQCELLIGVNLMPRVELAAEKLKGMLSAATIATRCFYLSVLNNTKASRDLCDVMIEPTEIDQYHIFQFNKAQDLMDLGYAATTKVLAEHPVFK